ncbi:PREDICTED: odorant receptor 63a-like [Eufriesea mexicana]|uniref:odorant receptor 63a-like n=1 Tax=Eufriesea mexicana TaxID=516756 RepID=UPI00083BD13D|nr:PREDICTED: odorant receptor 63a-like [Eufriesea mexicana]XP_017766916.1 PREDICTED: odorant receptor 63a-like [Eufriesea mexicana]
MRLTYHKDLSVNIASFYLRTTGFWLATSRREQLFRNATILYTAILVAYILGTEVRDLYFSFEDYVVKNFGRNESDRELLFNLWVDFPLSMSPYFEIVFTSQVLSGYQCGVCYLCFDNMFCIMCFHVGGQFRILQYRISNMLSLEKERNLNGDNNTYTSDKYCAIFKNCIEQHKALINFCDTLEVIFREIVLVEVIIFGILICFIGYQLVSIMSTAVSYFTILRQTNMDAEEN